MYQFVERLKIDGRLVSDEDIMDNSDDMIRWHAIVGWLSDVMGVNGHNHRFSTFHWSIRHDMLARWTVNKTRIQSGQELFSSCFVQINIQTSFWTHGKKLLTHNLHNSSKTCQQWNVWFLMLFVLTEMIRTEMHIRSENCCWPSNMKQDGHRAIVAGDFNVWSGHRFYHQMFL